MVGKKWQIVVPKDFESTDKSYHINGKQYLRVTATLGIIAKHRIDAWIKRIGHAKANQILETRQAIGIHVHKLIELTLKDEDFNLGGYELEIQEGMCKFYEFQQAASLKPDGLEQRLWSNKYGYAGTADFVGTYQSPPKVKTPKGVVQSPFLVRGHKPKFEKPAYVIGDWKTGKAFYPTYWLQLAAYAMAFKELTGIKVKGAFIARIRDGKLKVAEKTWDELELEFEAYIHALELYKWQHKLGKWGK